MERPSYSKRLARESMGIALQRFGHFQILAYDERMNAPAEPLRILFVCTGNLCRSPMAEGIARHLAAERGYTVEIRSCGTHANEGDPASENGVTACQEKDIDISAHRSQPLSAELIEWADQVLCMEENHILTVNSRDWRAPFKTWNLASFIDKKQIKDPYRRSLRKYRKARDEIWRAVDGALERIMV